MPTPEEIFATLAGGKKFSRLGLSQAYQQIPLDEAAKELITINTQMGSYRYNRLPFGVASAPAIFQRTMDMVLQGLPRVVCYVDDGLVTGTSDSEHLSNLAKVLDRLQPYGFWVKEEKCTFMVNSVDYLSHRIDADGLHATSEKPKAITEVPVPKNVTELRSFLGLLNYYGRFMPNLATLIHPLNHLLKNGIKWVWSNNCDQAFQEAKLL